jgi:hypothetical protein
VREPNRKPVFRNRQLRAERAAKAAQYVPEQRELIVEPFPETPAPYRSEMSPEVDANRAVDSLREAEDSLRAVCARISGPTSPAHHAQAAASAVRVALAELELLARCLKGGG